MSVASRLVANTVATYLRMVLTFGLGLLTVRLLVKTLGLSDYGLLAVMGATGALLAMISGAFTKSVTRFLAYEIGRTTDSRLHSMFNSAFAVYAVLGVILVAVGTALAPLILGALTIPEGRMGAVKLLYGLSLATLVLGLLTTPFKSILLAHQAMTVTAVLDTASSFVSIATVFVLNFIPYDKLCTYALLGFASSAAFSITYILISLKSYPECRLNLRLISRTDIRAMLGFTGWTVFGQVAWDVRNQGAVLIMNASFGTVVGAAYAIANQVMNYQNQLSFTIFAAIGPAITSMEAKGGKNRMTDMIVASSKFPTLACLLLFTPILLETTFLLKIWLTNYPDSAPLFAQLLCASMIPGILTYSLHQGLEAKGRIGAITLWLSIPQILVILISGLIFKFTSAPAWVLPALNLIAVAPLVGIFRPWYACRQLNIPLGVWVRSAFLPVLLVSAIAAIAVFPIRFFLHEGYLRLCFIVIANASALLVGGWIFAVSPFERTQLQSIYKKIKDRRMAAKQHRASKEV